MSDHPASEGRKDDAEKPRWDLLPFEPLGEVVGVLTYGAGKYAPDNWKHVPEARSRYFAAAMRHLSAWWDGETTDPDDGKHPLAHLLADGIILLWYAVHGVNP